MCHCLFWATCVYTVLWWTLQAWRYGLASVRLSVCLSVRRHAQHVMTHQRAACNAASIHFGPTVRRTEILVCIWQSAVHFRLHGLELRNPSTGGDISLLIVSMVPYYLEYISGMSQSSEGEWYSDRKRVHGAKRLGTTYWFRHYQRHTRIHIQRVPDRMVGWTVRNS